MTRNEAAANALLKLATGHGPFRLQLAPSCVQPWNTWPTCVCGQKRCPIWRCDCHGWWWCLTGEPLAVQAVLHDRYSVGKLYDGLPLAPEGAEGKVK